MFKDYKGIFEKIEKQHNIFVLVGNGFDIAVLNKYNKNILKGRTTSYNDFFDFLKYFNLVESQNLILEKMEKDKQSGKVNWSDFENSIFELFNSKKHSVDKLEKIIDEFQSHFTRYLNMLVDTDILLELNTEVQNNHLAKQSLGHLFRDFPGESFEILKSIDKYHLFNYVFANFNYTSLLDNYLFLDKNQFDPHYYKTVDRNFNIYIEDQIKYYSSYVVLDIIHPHGIQDIPRSILFGIDLEDYDKGISKEKRLVKEYWAQYNVKYKSYLDEADLYIIYGMSVGRSDSWWMDKIFENIQARGAELIIYKYGTESMEDIKNLFIERCVRNSQATNEIKNKVKEHIKPKTFQKNNTFFLGLENKIGHDVIF